MSKYDDLFNVTEGSPFGYAKVVTETVDALEHIDRLRAELIGYYDDRLASSTSSNVESGLICDAIDAVEKMMGHELAVIKRIQALDNIDHN